MSSAPNPQSDADQLEAAADQAIEACGGDAREAVKALIVANQFLETDLEKLRAAVSMGLRLPIALAHHHSLPLQASIASPCGVSAITNCRLVIRQGDNAVCPPKHAAAGLDLQVLAQHSNIGIERGPFDRHW